MRPPRLKSLFNRARTLGPYVLVELLLPGGTLLALLMWVAQHRRGLVRIAARSRARGVVALRRS